MKGKLSTHVLDISVGHPGAGISIQLWRLEGDRRKLLRSTITNLDGGTDAPLLDPGEMAAGEYELIFQVGGYFERMGKETFLQNVPIRFQITQPEEFYHVPLLVSPWGYSTYRGS
ncbi:MAG TPA: hydroxyisourate hydrolase [Chthoniobacterales bacterium]|jgi:5-hydroxyisourate hydrolase|nr:hydroxyisourate hydrolase [Chthoniobacterales bacterium]